MPLNADEDSPQPRATRRKPGKPPNTNKDTPQPCITRARGLGNTQKSKDTSQRASGDSEGVVEDEAEVTARIEKAKEELRTLEARKAAISKEIAQAEASAVVATSEPKIKRPPREVNIQVGMGLADDAPRYHAIRRCVTDLIGEAGINWELPWSQVPAVKKAKLYQAARKEIPYLAKFENDWPTKELAMQLTKNKRNHSYRRGYLEVPKQYAYLKQNAAKKKRGAQGSRSTRASTPQSDGSDSDEDGGTDDSADRDEPTDKSTVASGSTSKRARPVTVAAQPPRKKQKKTGTAKSTRSMATRTAKGKGKKASPIEAEAEEDGTSTGDGDEVDAADLEE